MPEERLYTLKEVDTAIAAAIESTRQDIDAAGDRAASKLGGVPKGMPNIFISMVAAAAGISIRAKVVSSLTDLEHLKKVDALNKMNPNK